MNTLLDKGIFMTDFLTRNPDTKDQIQAALIAAADKPEVRIAILEMLMNQKPEDIPAELKTDMIEANIQRGGFTSFQLLEYCSNSLNLEQQQKCRESIMSHLDTFVGSANPDVFQSFKQDVAQRKDYFLQKYGEAFVEKIESYKKIIPEQIQESVNNIVESNTDLDLLSTMEKDLLSRLENEVKKENLG